MKGNRRLLFRGSMSIDDVHIAYTDQYRRLRPRYIPALSLGGMLVFAAD